MNKIYTVLFAIMLTSNTYAIEVTIEVRDNMTSSPIEDASVKIQPGNFFLSTDLNGISVAKLPSDGLYSVNISRIGYKTLDETITVTGSNTKFIFVLNENLISTGEIKVYSGRLDQQLKYAVLPIVINTREEIQSLPGVTVPEVMRYRAGINLLRDGIWATDINIRGLSRDNVITLIDGNRVETANNHAARLSLIDLNSVERIEVIKGGTSSLYGSGAVGGIIAITTGKGTFTDFQTFKGNLSGRYSTVNEMSSGTLNLQYSNNNFFFNLTGSLREATDTKTPEGVIPNSAFRDNNFLLNAGLKLSDKMNLSTNLQRSYSPFAGIPGGNLLFPAPADVSYRLAKREMADLIFNVKDFSKTFYDVKFKIYLQNIIRDVNIIPNTVVFVPASGNNPARRINNLLLTPSGKHYTKGINLDASLFLSNTTKSITGIDLWMRDLETSRERTQRIDILDSNNNVVSSSTVVTGDIPIPDSRFINAGVYLQNETSFLNDKVYMQYGGRLDFIFVSNEQSVNPLYIITNGNVNNNPPNQTVLWEKGKENDVSWSLNSGVNYKLTPTLNLNANFSASFRSPSLEERYQYIDLGNIVRLGNPALKPELGFFTSVGLKMWSQKLNFSFELFSNFLQDQVVEIPGTFESRPALIKSNVGKSRIAGFDVEAEFELLNELAIYSNVSFVNGEDTETSAPLPQIPPLNGVFGVKAYIPGIAVINANAIVYSDQKRVSTGEIPTSGYTVYNLFVNFDKLNFDRFGLKFSAGVENIFNKKYRDHLSTNRGSITSEPGINFFINSSLSY